MLCTVYAQVNCRDSKKKIKPYFFPPKFTNDIPFCDLGLQGISSDKCSDINYIN